MANRIGKPRIGPHSPLTKGLHMVIQASPLWNSLTPDIAVAQIDRFRQPDGPNSRLAHWKPNEPSLRWFKSYLQLAAKTNPIEQIIQLEALGGGIDLGSPITVDVFREEIQRTVQVNLDYLYSVEENAFLQERLFEKEEIGTVIEIGGGFGRTAHTLLTLNNEIERYEILDLPGTLSLSYKYLTRVLPKEIQSKLEFIDVTTTEVSARDSDLIIQIDGFQEMTREVISDYFEGVVSRSRFAYFCNPMGKYLPNVAGVEGLNPQAFEETRELGRHLAIVDPWNDEDLRRQVRPFSEAYMPSNFFLLDSNSSFLRPYYLHALCANRTKASEV